MYFITKRKTSVDGKIFNFNSVRRNAYPSKYSSKFGNPYPQYLHISVGGTSNSRIFHEVHKQQKKNGIICDFRFYDNPDRLFKARL